MDDCLFCKIISGEIPSTVVYQDEDCIAIRRHQSPDAHPCAGDAAQAFQEPDRGCRGRSRIGRPPDARAPAPRSPVRKALRRTATAWWPNIGVNGAQTVQHLHLHVMGGVKLSEQMA